MSKRAIVEANRERDEACQGVPTALEEALKAKAQAPGLSHGGIASPRLVNGF